ncbi:MAG: interleukin-like EMT inducer domain-containing protein [Caldilineaceae bacterium]
MPLSDFRIPALYERLAAMPGDFTLLELPTGWRNGARVMGKSDILIMMQQWYQTAHGKRRLGGNTSRNPLYKFQYFTDAPLIGDLIALMNATPSADLNQNELPRQVEATFDELVARNRGIAPTVLDFLGVQYVTVHVEKTPPLLQRFVAEVLPVTLLEQWQGTDWSGAPATIDLYAVTPQPVQPQWSIELATTTSTLYLAEGWATLPWQGVRYATRPCATLLLDLPTHAGRLTLQLAEPATPTSISLNDRPLPFGPTRAPSTVTVDFVADQAAALVDRLTLCAETATPLTALANPPNAAGWPIGGTGAAVAADLFVRSAGSDVGNFAQILRNGAPVMPTARGYNLAAFDPAGALLMTATFDTHLTAAAGEALAAWVAALPADTIVAGAVMDEASNALDDGAVQALATLGVAADLRGRFRWSHAFMGVKGAPAGSAVEQLSLLQPATVTVGVAVDAPTVYLGIRKLDYQMTD